MSSIREEYTFFWHIENYSFCWHENGTGLVSPNFTVDILQCTTWNLHLYPRGMNNEDKGHISLFLNRCQDGDGPEKVFVNYELSCLAADGSALWCNDCDYEFTRDDGYGISDFLKMNEVILQEKAYYLPQDVLTMRCKIWKGDGNALYVGQSSARTRIRIEKNYFLHEVESFSTLQPNVKHTTKSRYHSNKGGFITSSLYFSEENMMSEIVLPYPYQILGKCELSMLDNLGNVIECGMTDNRCDAERKSVHVIPLSLTREAVLARKSELLPDDKLSLICECYISSGIEFQTVEETLNGVPLALIKQKSNNKDNEAAEEKSSAHPSALEDIKSLYINQFLTDVVVKTETKSFPAHKVVLCARSPVFKAMLTSDMKEKITDCIRIDDLEDDVVQQLLLFLYSDKIVDLQWESAMDLYYVADKYQIGKLKEVCSFFLLENLSTTNAAALLLLADTHNDSDLKGSVEDFVLENDEEIFISKEWEAIIEKNPLLVIKTMQLKYKR